MRDAEEMFYAIKAMEIKVGMLEEKIKGQMSLKERQAFQQQRQEIQANFDDYDERIKKLGILDLKEDDLLIVKMARLFGECEIGMPEDFIKEVKKYIGYWKSSPRLTNALQMASKRGYTQTIIREMRAQNMPQHFFYLALQESNFDPKAVGPKTRVGIAKGPWQFMPKTAAEYGLKMGPLVSYRKFDPQDDRHNFLKSTRAAARHIKHLYNTKAQGSGMNIIASYNVGEGYMGKLISKMPRNPRERNFWKLLKNHKIPRETYDYVFYIFSAAVIGENPRLFGFDFNRPLA
ncbi:MAG: hypothetical protein NPIRA04_04670 [Nitrospirales bacterium]|nr:MAG: hypothetical protein NPIRA04_04670 [Nitrospirales bacterium]